MFSAAPGFPWVVGEDDLGWIVAVAPKGRDFRTLRVWEKAHQLTLMVYRHSNSFPREELFGMTSQIRRAAASIPANIAEGCGIGGNDFARFCRVAAGSASELQYHLLLSNELGYLEGAAYIELEQMTSEVERMLSGLFVRISETGVREDPSEYDPGFHPDNTSTNMTSSELAPASLRHEY